MNLMLDGKVVLIAQAPSELTPALVSALRREGAHAVLRAQEGQPLPEGAEGVRCGSLTDIPTAEAIRDDILNRFGRLDALVFCADTPMGSSLMETEASALRQGLDAARKAFICCKVFADAMGSHTGGSMVFITTLHDEKPNGADVAHSMAQGMVQNLVMEATLEYGERNIRVNQIALGASEGSAERFKSEITSFYEGSQYKTPAGRLASPGDLAELAAFLISDKSAFINGARIRVDGGLTLHYLDFKANSRALAARESRQI